MRYLEQVAGRIQPDWALLDVGCGPNWWNLDVPRHLVFFPPETLRRALAEAGFDLVRIETFTLPLYAGMSLVQALGLRHWARHKDMYPLLSALLAFPLLPFYALMPEFLFAVAKAK